jgi:hypothetical protein
VLPIFLAGLKTLFKMNRKDMITRNLEFRLKIKFK